MRLFKKNQVVVAVIGLMLITAGYLNFTNNENNNSLETGALADSEQMAAIGDATLVSTNPTEENIIKESEENVIEETNEEIENDIQNDINNTIQTNSKTETKDDEYFTKSRLERDTMYSQMLESYQKVLGNTNISETQKKEAQKEITNINEERNAIMITENLIKLKGFDDLIILMNDKSINIIIKSKKLESDQIAQIQNIVTRELKAKIEDIHISNKE